MLAHRQAHAIERDAFAVEEIVVPALHAEFAACVGATDLLDDADVVNESGEHWR